MTSYQTELQQQETKANKELIAIYDEFIAFLFAIAIDESKTDKGFNSALTEREKFIRAYNKQFAEDNIPIAYTRSYDMGFAEQARKRRRMSNADQQKIDIVTSALITSLHGMSNGYVQKAQNVHQQRKLDKVLNVDRRYRVQSSMALRNNKGQRINPRSLATAYSTINIWQAGNYGYASSLVKMGLHKVKYRTQRDDRVCPICRAKEGETLTLPNDYPFIPPTHHLCRCYITPIKNAKA